MNRKSRHGIVYSTDPKFNYDDGDAEEQVTLPPEKQHLKIMLDSRNRKGKQVTLITGYKGRDSDLQLLARELKTFCGAGGSAKNSEIIVQGDCRDKIMKFLSEKHYNIKKAGG